MTHQKNHTRNTGTGDITRKKPRSFYVYLLLCDDGSYYTGYTSNPNFRLLQHEKGRGARYTRMRRPIRIVHLEEFNTRVAAMKRERQVKALTHNQKNHLARRIEKQDTNKK